MAINSSTVAEARRRRKLGAIGLSDDAEALRKRTVEMGRSDEAAKVAEAIAAAPESQGSVIA